MLKQIKELKVGDKVLSWDVVKQEPADGVITELFQKTSDHYYAIMLAKLNKANPLGIIHVTGEHPFYVIDKDGETYDWVFVKDLKPGDILLQSDGDFTAVADVEKIDEEIEIYNIEVEDNHNYFAGGVLVHNKLGRYYGKDDTADTARNKLNSATERFNKDIFESARDALAEQVKELQAHKMAMGSMEGLFDAEGNVQAGTALAGDIPDGAAGDMVKAIKEAERNRLDQLNAADLDAEAAQKSMRGDKSEGLLTAGTAYKEQQMNINKAVEASGMVSAGERAVMDNAVAASQAQSEVQRKAEEQAADIQTDLGQAKAQAELDKQNAIAAASDDFAKAEADSLASVREATKAPMDDHTGVVMDNNKKMEAAWDGARSTLDTNRLKKNWRNHIDHKRADYVNPEGSPPNIPWTGTWDKHGGKSYGYVVSGDLKTEDGVNNAMNHINKVSGQGISGFENLGDEDGKTPGMALAKIWQDSANASHTGYQIVGGRDQPGKHASGTDPSNQNYIHRRGKGDCFKGDTLIEVIV